MRVGFFLLRENPLNDSNLFIMAMLKLASD